MILQVGLGKDKQQHWESTKVQGCDGSWKINTLEYFVEQIQTIDRILGNRF